MCNKNQINSGGYFKGSFCGGGEVKLPSCLKLVRIMPKTWNLVCKYIHICFSGNIPFTSKTLLILLMSAFFYKKSAFSGKRCTFTQIYSMRAVLEMFKFSFQFL